MIKILTIFFIIIITYTITKYILLNSELTPCDIEYYVSHKNDYGERKDANLSFHKNECKSCDYSENVGNEFIDSIARLNEFYINL